MKLKLRKKKELTKACLFWLHYAEVVAHGDSELDKMSAMEREAERLRMVLDIKVKLQLKTAINRAVSRNDMATVMDALEVSAEMHRKDSNNVPEFVQRHLLSLSIWEELRFWDGYFDYSMMRSLDNNKSADDLTLWTAQLVVVATHMVLG
ncbi:DENN domain and WD repeat-containing protein SCD1 [Carex littledalei]|uniref:DENN domain and WD repeat-containing protein SCD1 n=1 Tax=Carex littledalei TaxID=544730 RepID=A0A833QHM7_9POAL|nr:DENN domain and WD repeat-containing protein SCD1 [Carex littledalei]